MQFVPMKLKSSLSRLMYRENGMLWHVGMLESHGAEVAGKTRSSGADATRRELEKLPCGRHV